MTTFLSDALLASPSGEWHGDWWPLWPIFWLAVIAAVVWLVSRRRRDGGPRGGARAILAERFARGEIDGDEYRARLEQLG